MGRRNKKEKGEHDRCVRRSVGNLRKRGYTVAADIPGYARPDTIDGCRPDFRAWNDEEEIVGEVETPASVDSARDKKQQAVFQKYANRSLKRRFVRIVTDDC